MATGAIGPGPPAEREAKAAQLRGLWGQQAGQEAPEITQQQRPITGGQSRWVAGGVVVNASRSGSGENQALGRSGGGGQAAALPGLAGIKEVRRRKGRSASSTAARPGCSPSQKDVAGCPTTRAVWCCWRSGAAGQ